MMEHIWISRWQSRMRLIASDCTSALPLAADDDTADTTERGALIGIERSRMTEDSSTFPRWTQAVVTPPCARRRRYCLGRARFST